MTIYHDQVSYDGPPAQANNQIVEWMTPIANYLKDLPAGWTIPIGGSVHDPLDSSTDCIAILFVLSFPPLFGQEVSFVVHETFSS
jgi:hypothetical protein